MPRIRYSKNMIRNLLAADNPPERTFPPDSPHGSSSTNSNQPERFLVDGSVNLEPTRKKSRYESDNLSSPAESDPTVPNLQLKFGKKGNDEVPPDKHGTCDFRKCDFSGTVYKFWHKRNHKNKDKFYCTKCIVDLRTAGKKRADKCRAVKKDKGPTPVAVVGPSVVGPSAPTSAVYIISGVIKLIGKMTVGIGPFPLFYEDRHALSLFTSQVSSQVLQVGRKLIAGDGWKQLCNGWNQAERGFGMYKVWGLNEGNNNYVEALRKAMKVEKMSAEVKVVQFLVDYLLNNHNMDKDEIFVKVGIIQTIKPTQQVRSFFVELIYYKSNNHY